jgi:N-acetyl-gamma-glutamylphosphate reductase
MYSQMRIDIAMSMAWLPSSSPVVVSTYCALATKSQAQLVHVEYQKRKFVRLLPRDGIFKASNVQGTKFAPIQMIQVLMTVGRMHGLWL